MKKVIKICTMLLTLIFALSVLAICVSASTTCEGAERNVASHATVTPDMIECDFEEHFIGNRWPILNGLKNINDGNYLSGAVSDHRDDIVSFWMSFDDTYDFTKIAITTYGVGRMETSKVATDYASGVFQQFDIEIYLYNENGTQVDYQKKPTTEDGPVIFDVSAAGPACKMRVFL